MYHYFIHLEVYFPNNKMGPLLREKPLNTIKYYVSYENRNSINHTCYMCMSFPFPCRHHREYRDSPPKARQAVPCCINAFMWIQLPFTPLIIHSHLRKYDNMSISAIVLHDDDAFFNLPYTSWKRMLGNANRIHLRFWNQFSRREKHGKRIKCLRSLE